MKNVHSFFDNGIAPATLSTSYGRTSSWPGFRPVDSWTVSLGVRPTPSFHRGATHVLQLCILGSGLLEDRDVGVDVVPRRKEVLIGLSCLGVITRQRVSPAELQVCQSTNRIADNESSVIENLLEFRIGLSAVMCGHIGQIGRVEITGAQNESDNKQTLPPNGKEKRMRERPS